MLTESCYTCMLSYSCDWFPHLIAYEFLPFPYVPITFCLGFPKDLQYAMACPNFSIYERCPFYHLFILAHPGRAPQITLPENPVLTSMSWILILRLHFHQDSSYITLQLLLSIYHAWRIGSPFDLPQNTQHMGS